MSSVKTGLDVVSAKNFQGLLGKRIGILCNQASVNSSFQHILELILPLHRNNKLHIQAVFGPQHGLWGHTQDNMIEWEGSIDRQTGLRIYSLYGMRRKPNPEMLDNIELFVVDLQDVGSRYYTFIWTMALCMRACQEQDIAFMILDRPNPIGGLQIEGTLLDPEFSSFVGLYPLTQRHGMTIGEIAAYLRNEFFPKLNLSIITVSGWQRKMLFDDTGLPWIIPSPNMPASQTALVYPGMCLLEGTNLSEGRGTTRPFEIFGAPWLNGRALCTHLNNRALPGVYFRPVEFQPTFQKYAGEVCEGGFIHVTNSETFKPVLTVVAILEQIMEYDSDNFLWKNPPYEYEQDKLPFDILAGNSWLREMIEKRESPELINRRMSLETEEFRKIRANYLLYY